MEWNPLSSPLVRAFCTQFFCPTVCRSFSPPLSSVMAETERAARLHCLQPKPWQRSFGPGCVGLQGVGGGWGGVRGNGHSDISHTGMWQREVLLVNAVHYCLDSQGLSCSPGHTWLSRWPGWTFSHWLYLPPHHYFKRKCDWPQCIAFFMSGKFWHFNKVLRNERSISGKAAWITAI